MRADECIEKGESGLGVTTVVGKTVGAKKKKQCLMLRLYPALSQGDLWKKKKVPVT